MARDYKAKAKVQNIRRLETYTLKTVKIPILKSNRLESRANDISITVARNLAQGMLKNTKKL